MKITGTNLFALRRELEANNGAIPSRVQAGTFHHLSRCIRAGLLVADAGGCFVLSAAGKVAVGAAYQPSWPVL